MSLVNQMLKDLESSREPGLESGDAVLAGLNPVPSRAAGSQTYLIIGLIGLLFGALVLSALNWYSSDPVSLLDPPVATVPNQKAVSVEPPAKKEQAVIASAETDVAEKVTPFANKNISEIIKPPLFQLETRLAKIPTQLGTKPDSVTSKNANTMKSVIHKPKPAAAKRQPAKETSVSQVEKKRVFVSPEERSARAYREGLSAMRAGRNLDAQSAFERALKIWVGHLSARESLALLSVNLGRTNQGIELLEEGIRIDPSHASFRKLLARIHLGQGRAVQAIEVLETLRLPVRSDTELAALKAALYQRVGNHRTAAGLYRQLVLADESNGLWWIGLAISLEAIGDIDNAREAFLKTRNASGLSPQTRQYAQRRLDAIR